MRQAVSSDMRRYATRASGGVLRRLLAIVVTLNVVAGCATQQGTPGPSAGSSGETSPAASTISTPGPSESEASPAPSGFFTDPPAPHDLQPTLASSAAASGVIGWEGGTIEATGPDGATYTIGGE